MHLPKKKKNKKTKKPPTKLIEKESDLWLPEGEEGEEELATLVIKNLPANARDVKDMNSFPGWRKSPGERNGNPLQYSCLENAMDRGAWQATVHGITKSQTRLKQLSMHAQSAGISFQL